MRISAVPTVSFKGNTNNSANTDSKPKGKYALPIALGVIVCGGLGALLYPRKSRSNHSQSDEFIRSNKK